jgi:flavin reductase (DIM6/NTAB) family NADH-FMN oxidoreductase RutF
MMKTLERPLELLYPLPVILVTTRSKKDKNETDNIVALSWVGIIDSDPPTININMSKGKYSGKTIKATREFGICVPRATNIKEVDICGSTHGDEIDKFKLTGLKKVQATEIDVPLIGECPIQMECRLEDVIDFGRHEMFVAKVVKTHVDEQYFQGSRADFKGMGLLCYVDGSYYRLGDYMADLFFCKKSMKGEDLKEPKDEQ